MRKRSRRTPKPKGPSWAIARRVFERHRARILRRKDVVGVDLGIKRADGRLQRGPCIRIHVERKLPPHLVSKRRLLPHRIEGVPTDVVECGFHHSACPGSASAHRRTLDPLLGGCSIGRFGEESFGTLGAIVQRSEGVGAISCAHVVGEDDRVRQKHDTGRKIGRVTLAIDTAQLDACFLPLEPGLAWTPELLGYGAIGGAPRDLTPSDLPFPVELVGACSGRSRGQVISVSFSGWVEGTNGSNFVSDQMCIESDGGGVFARGGDSGGVLAVGTRLVGMLIAAGEPELGGKGLATPMSRVFDRLSVSLP